MDGSYLEDFWFPVLAQRMCAAVLVCALQNLYSIEPYMCRAVLILFSVLFFPPCVCREMIKKNIECVY